jgi:ABC-type multidrug transport system fused ATPase/permease subunit
LQLVLCSLTWGGEQAEHLVQEALDKMMVGRTTIIVAHRLSTVMNADVVVVLDGGTVGVGLSRITALYQRSSTLYVYHIH